MSRQRPYGRPGRFNGILIHTDNQSGPTRLPDTGAQIMRPAAAATPDRHSKRATATPM
jgi:hypothetical protein